MDRWAPLDIIILVLTLTICSMILGMIYHVIVNHAEGTSESGERTLSLVLALVGIINAYVVANIQKSVRKNGGAEK